MGNSLAVPQSIATKTPNPRQKVLLAPGHSPLDWAHLQKSGTNLSGVDRLVRVTPSMLKHNNGRKGRPAWSVYQGKVYNISPYIPFHPGGEGELRRAAGKDGEKLFMEVHPWVNWENMLGECLVGIMVTEHDGVNGQESTLDDMD
jgi:cytochrome b involved in lipid metabolism